MKDDLFGTDGAPRWRLSARMLAELAAAKAGPEAARLLEFIRPGEDREKMLRFMVHFYSYGRAKILPHFERLAEEAIRRGWNLPIGSDTLAGWARGTIRDFTIDNDLRPFYVVALSIARPEFARHCEHSADLPNRLLLLEWNPFAKGGK